MISSSGARATIARGIEPLGQRLARAGVSPDVVTVVGTLGVSAAAIGFLPRGDLFVGALVITLFVFSDLVDGALARARGETGPWGAWLDSTLDRVGDAAIFGSLVWWYAGGGHSKLIAAVALVCLVAGSVTSYAKARAEGLGLTANVGIAERAERLILTLVACGLDGLFGLHWLLPAALWVLAVLSVVTVGQRSVEVFRQAHAGRPGAG
jgi:CDP-diacylglycerol--glycerol-3-phosphate 3-phosphatidyltransferase